MTKVCRPNNVSRAVATCTCKNCVQNFVVMPLVQKKKNDTRLRNRCSIKLKKKLKYKLKVNSHFVFLCENRQKLCRKKELFLRSLVSSWVVLVQPNSSALSWRMSLFIYSTRRHPNYISASIPGKITS